MASLVYLLVSMSLLQRYTLYIFICIGIIGGISAGVISVPGVIGGVSKYFEDDKTQSTVTGILMSLAATGIFIFTP